MSEKIIHSLQINWWYVSDILKITWQACPLSLEDGKEVPHLEVIEIILTTLFVTLFISFSYFSSILSSKNDLQITCWNSFDIL